jgi:hypothetical protein
MKLGRDVDGILPFAVLIPAVICDGFGIWMGWLPTH